MLLSLALLASLAAAPAPVQSTRTNRCYIQIDKPTGEGTDWYLTQPIDSPEERQEVVTALEAHKDEIAQKIGMRPQDRAEAKCGTFDDGPGFVDVKDWGTFRLFDIAPYFDVASIKRAPKGHRVTLVWREGQGGTEGYRSASIDLVYGFLQCAGEIHMAYGLDRGSFKAANEYWIPAASNRPGSLVPVDAPPAPSSLRLIGTVVYKAYPPHPIANIDDHFAGEALGMGCFDGQTQKLGTVAKLVGPAATPDKVKAFLADLEFEPPLYLVEGALTRIGMASAAAASAAAEAKARAEAEAAERQRQEAAALAEANARLAARAEEQRKAIEATLEQNRQAQAAYQSSMAQYRDGVAAADAQRKAYEARLAEHQACLAGDQAACQRYVAGN